MFRVLAPPVDLQPFVRFFWAVRASAAAPERVIPDGCCELILHFGARPRRVGDQAYAPKQPAAFVFGQIERAILLDAGGELDVYGARFTPAGVAALWGFDVSALGPQECALDDLFPRSQRLPLASLEDAAASAQGSGALQTRYAAVVSWLRATARRKPVRHASRAAAALSCFEQTGADAMRVARAVGVSRRSLERDFRTAVGLSPAAYRRLRRIDWCARELRRENAALATIAFDAGYADQSHFCREFKDVAGLSPGDYRRRCGLAPAALSD